MTGFSDADYATIIAAFIIALIPAYLGPRLTRIGFLQRGDILDSLSKLNPVFQRFRSQLPGPSAGLQTAFVCGFFIAIVGPVGLGGLITQTYAVSPAGLFFLLFSIVTRAIGNRAAIIANPTAGATNQKPVARKYSPSAPAIWYRLLLLQLSAFAGVGFAFWTQPADIGAPGTWTFLIEILAFGVWYSFQDLDLVVTTEGALFERYLEDSNSEISVLVYASGSGLEAVDPVRGKLTGIGKKLRLARDDGYVEELSWASASRVAVKLSYCSLS